MFGKGVFIMKKFIITMLMTMGLVNVASADNIQLLRNMFNDMVIKKDISVMPKYYAPDFKLYSNGMVMNYQQYYVGHKREYQTPIQYQVAYDSATIFESKHKVAARVFITTKRPHEAPTKIEVILIAAYNDKHKLERIWELTYPNWSRLKAFKSFSK
jgi:hypothetical protein